jgi:hypothetical protein
MVLIKVSLGASVCSSDAPDQTIRQEWSLRGFVDSSYQTAELHCDE